MSVNFPQRDKRPPVASHAARTREPEPELMRGGGKLSQGRRPARKRLTPTAVSDPPARTTAAASRDFA